MYKLQDSVLLIKGVGKNLQENLFKKNIDNILDLLLFLPLRYEDRSDIKSIKEIKNLTQEETQISKSDKNQKVSTNFATTKAKVLKWNEYRKGRLLIGRATISDREEQLNCIWFNNRFLKNKIIVGQEFIFSGNFKDGSLVQATVEKTDGENIHTGRLVPIYSQLADFKQGSLRRILAEAISKLYQAGELEGVFKNLHFPKQIEDIITARERLALEEILYLMKISAKHKQELENKKTIFSLNKNHQPSKLELPFELTKAQVKAVAEIFADLKNQSPMNRLLVGDVGSGKTIVAAIPAIELIKQDQSVCLIAPTKILAKQHYEKLKSIFTDTNFSLVTSAEKLKEVSKNTFYIGTHSLLGYLTKIEPSLVIYDEQQRFGVKHRQLEEYLSSVAKRPHLLNMTATPIPRSLMLSIFSHLELSYLDQMPNQRKMATTWLVPQQKQEGAIEWIVKQLLDDKEHQKQVLIICPFINPSSYKATENVAAVKDSFEQLNQELKKIYQKLKVPKSKQFKTDVLHSKLSKAAQNKVIDGVYQEEIQILVSTPMVEVGVDLPNADIIVIQSAERFGLSSLHQLRGRVGRQGQDSYCLLFRSASNEKDQNNKERLEKFCQEKDGLKLAQIDLENRGAGDILGYKQSGFNNLRFASWTNLEIIKKAKEKFENEPNYQSLLKAYLEKINQEQALENATN